MKRIGIIANCTKPAAEPVLHNLEEAAEECGLELYADPSTRRMLNHARLLDQEALDEGIDVLMALGGDGTVLGAAKVLQGRNIPVMGVNLGRLGFMTSVLQDQIQDAIRALSVDAITISNRTTLSCRVYRNGSDAQEEHQAVNDVVLGWGTSSRVVTLQLAVNGLEVTQYVCDGLIISTPTGSTGHSLSAGGPILHPETNAFVVNAICPHTLSTRPMVLPDDRTLTVRIDRLPEGKNLILSIDGQQMKSFKAGDLLEISRHPVGIRFVHLLNYRYFEVLAQKLGWKGTSTEK